MLRFYSLINTLKLKILDTALESLESAVRADPALKDLAAMGAGFSTDDMRVAGVPVGVDAWVMTFAAKKARSVITDIAKLDVVSDGLHNQLLNFCQNARMAFLGRNTPTPLLSEFMTQVEDTIVEVVCSHGTGGGHMDWSPHLRKFANMKIQVLHFRGGIGITPNESSAISAFYSATCALVVWLGIHGGTRPAQDFADTGARAECYFSRLLACTSSAGSFRIACSSPSGLWSFFLPLSLNPHSLTCLRRRLSKCTSTGTLLVFCRTFPSKSL